MRESTVEEAPICAPINCRTSDNYFDEKSVFFHERFLKVHGILHVINGRRCATICKPTGLLHICSSPRLQALQVMQLSTMHPTPTCWPTRIFVTPEPTATHTPASSWPGT